MDRRRFTLGLSRRVDEAIEADVDLVDWRSGGHSFTVDMASRLSVARTALGQFAGGFSVESVDYWTRRLGAIEAS